MADRVKVLVVDDSLEHSISQADVALYAAKAQGRNRVHVAPQESPPTAQA